MLYYAYIEMLFPCYLTLCMAPSNCLYLANVKKIKIKAVYIVSDITCMLHYFENNAKINCFRHITSYNIVF